MYNVEQISQEDFIDQVVIPYFYGNLYKDIVVIVYGLDGKIIFTNHRYANFFEYELDDIIGKKFGEYSQNINISEQIAKKIDSIRQTVIQTQQEVKYVLFLDTPEKAGAYVSLHFPIFYYDGSVIATAVRADNFVWLPKTTLFSNLSPNAEFDKSVNYSKITLTSRQQEVLFLLIAGFSQEQIATHLNISRGTVSSCIANLCKKFGVYGQNTFILTSIASKLQYGSVIPESLIKAGVVIL